MKMLFKRESNPPILPSACLGFVDQITPTSIFGWAADKSRPDRPVFVDISVNHELVARVRACIRRRDLEMQGYGDGCNGFFFNPVQYLKWGENQIRVSFTGTPETLANGYRTVFHEAALVELQVDSQFSLHELSQTRWKGDEEDTSLTWDQILTGDSFVDAVLKHHGFTGQETILEVGPGYGRLLATMLDRQLPFSRYVGIELSSARVKRLTKKFHGPTVGFVEGDILRDTLDLRADLVVGSATFDLLYPSMVEALHNLYQMSRLGTKVFIDFILYPGDEDLCKELAYFESKPTFIRVYSRREIEEMFTQTGFRILGLEKMCIGKDRYGADVRRALIIADRPA